MKRLFSILRKIVQRAYRLVTTGNKKPKIIREVGFDFYWDDTKVQALDEPTTEMDIGELIWHFDIHFWDEIVDDWNLTPREVIEHPKFHKDHYQKIMQSDLRYPISITKNKGKWLVLDGRHLLAKAYIKNRKTEQCAIIPRERRAEVKQTE